jgi:hypothetical protein
MLLPPLQALPLLAEELLLEALLLDRPRLPML